MARITDGDIALARRLPDDFVAGGGGSAIQRLIEIVGQNWARLQMKARAELVEVLLPILEPLLAPGARVSRRDRDVCEAIVTEWIELQ